MASQEQEPRQENTDKALDPSQELWANMFYHMYEETRKFDPVQAEILATSYLQDEISWTDYLLAGIDMCGDAIDPMPEAVKAENQFLADCIKAMKS